MSAGAENDALVRADLAFFGGLLDSDIAALKSLLADQFLIVDVASASVHTRAGFLAAICSRAVSFLEIKTFPDEVEIRVIGPGVGIVIGRTAMTLSDAENAIIEVASRYTHVFQLGGERWRLVSAQGTPMTGPGPQR
jgi:ketosteroid isomerase-like protein